MARDPEKLLLSQPTEKDRAMFEYYKSNPDMACIDLLNQDLAPFQRAVVRGVQSHSYVISVLARGSGKTRMIAMNAAILAMFNPKMRVGFFAPGFRQSKLAFMEFEAILNESPHLDASVKKISRQTDMWSVEFHNGSFIFALPLAADNAASIRGTRVHAAMIDEYPHVSKEVIDLVINPMLATQRNPMKNVRRIEREKELAAMGEIVAPTESEQNKICGFSSAYYQFNHMYKSICNYRNLGELQKKKEGKSDYAVYVYTYKDAPEGFFDDKMIAHAKSTSSEIAFRMEYESEFPADSDGFFKRSLIDSCVSSPPNEFHLEMKGEKGFKYVIGIDPARSDDNFSISILKLVGETMKLVRVVTFNKTPFPEVAQFIRKLSKEYDVLYIGVDKGGGGLAMKDDLANPMTADSANDILLDADDDENVAKKGRKILKMVDFSTRWISEANHDMRVSMEHKKLMFPAHREGSTFIKPDADSGDLQDQAFVDYFALIDELQAIIVTATKTGALHFDTPNPHMKKDRYSSLLVAHKIAYDFMVEGYQPKELAMGGWLGTGGSIIMPGNEHQEQHWEQTRIIDEISAAHRAKARLGDGSLID